MNSYRNINRNVMLDTQHQYETVPELVAAVGNSISRQYMVAQEDIVEVTPAENSGTRYVVSGKRSFEAAKGYDGKKVAVLNFANNHSIGGAPFSAGAQEESLCRCSTLLPCLQAMREAFYERHIKLYEAGKLDHMGNDDIIYTPDVTVFKTDTDRPELMPEEDWYDVDVITCAAPNLRQKPSNTYNSGDGQKPVRISDRDLQALHEKRLRRILDVAVMEGVDCIILGAFGCGAFMNSPRCVATAAARVVPEYLFAFRNIEFAVYCRPDDDTNYRVFRSMLGRFVKNGPQT